MIGGIFLTDGTPDEMLMAFTRKAEAAALAQVPLSP